LQMFHRYRDMDLSIYSWDMPCYQGILGLWNIQVYILYMDLQTIQLDMYMQQHCFDFDIQH
jgi:hypothetical protein